MQLVKRIDRFYDWDSHPIRDDPTQNGFWSMDEIIEDPNLAIDYDHRHSGNLFQRLESRGALQIGKDKVIEKKNQYGEVTNEILCRRYLLNYEVLLIRVNTHYLSPDMPDVSLVEESIKIRDYLSFRALVG